MTLVRPAETNTRLTDSIRATRKDNVSNDTAQHHLQTNHPIDWDSDECFIYSVNYY